MRLVLTLLLASSAWADGPEVSRSRGSKRGVLVFAPRVVPALEQGTLGDDSELAGYVADNLQPRLAQLAQRAAPQAKIEQRPAPERVCVAPGCKGLNLGVLLGHYQGGCFALALVSGGGEAPVRLAPWAGKLELSAQQVPQGVPPESVVTVSEFVPCDDLLDQLDDAPVLAALAAARGAGGS